MQEVQEEQEIKEVQEEQQEEQKQPELNLEPNETLYINKINDRVSLVELKESLMELFSEHGKVLDIVAKKNLKMRGQAFVVMDQVEDAIKAQEALNNHLLFENQIRVQFAKEKSDFILKKENRLEEKKERIPLSKKIEEHKQKIQEKRKLEMMNQKNTGNQPPTISMPMSQGNSYQVKERGKNANQPNKVLFVEGLHQVDFMELEMFFRNFIGFREFRGIKPKGVAFVEFDDELKATHCLNELNGFPFQGVQLQISYQKK